ncbi:MAG TPA: hypothetical protein VKA64_02115 [Gammaproteobacteria bacterium]|nr:hypothetical protein [Gammaproteobacteria bacterium]
MTTETRPQAPQRREFPPLQTFIVETTRVRRDRYVITAPSAEDAQRIIQGDLEDRFPQETITATVDEYTEEG